jgi:SAM-dependent methyltransferase
MTHVLSRQFAVHVPVWIPASCALDDLKHHQLRKCKAHDKTCRIRNVAWLTIMGILTVIASRIRQDGIAGLLRLMAGRVASRLRSAVGDVRRGVATEEPVSDEELGFANAANHAYVATDYAAISRALDSIVIDPETDVFVDVGCGKGRVVVAAAEYPFRRVIGVELSERLIDVAQHNVRNATNRRCGAVELVHCDATSWEIPADVNVMFFFNPFDGEVLASVCRNIRTSLRQHPRKLRIIYVRPDKFFERETDWREWLVPRLEFPYSDGKVTIYESL